ncbi:phospholipase D-like domain-containing protein [Aquibacillus kalidii]|uniref:phospholipase D-like domain-containing protein n=1 Tax=Aquibacillus kalidii TaxID=2762597 RepID=UPI0016481085|nr:phospholipase D-like domain-containing protein [Aquibacillus kalidii]
MDLISTAGATLTLGCISYLIYKMKGSNTDIEKTEIDYVFSKSERSPKQKLIELIDGSTNSLDIAIFTLTEKEIVSHICEATERGVQVRVMTDKKQSTKMSKQAANIQKMIQSGIPVKVNNHKGFMHLKMMIVDDEVVTSGSYNYTYSAEKRHDEVVVIIKDKQMSKGWKEQFEAMWTDSFNYTPYLYGVTEKLA